MRTHPGWTGTLSLGLLLASQGCTLVVGLDPGGPRDAGAFAPGDPVAPRERVDSGLPVRDDDAGPQADPGDGGPDAPCTPTLDFFDAEVYPAVFGNTCVACHVPGGVAQHTRLLIDEGDLEKTRRSVGNVARADVDGQPLLLVKPFGGADHGGGQVLLEDGPERALLVELVERVRDPATCDPFPFGSSVCEAPRQEDAKVRLLTRAELDATVRAAFGVAATTADQRLPEETRVNGFDSAASFLVVDGARADGILGLALDVTPAVSASLSCETRDAACVRDLLEGALPRLWRRPASAAELDGLMALFTDASSNGGTFDEGLEAVLTAAIGSPDTLYREELGEAGQLTPYETAELLAFTITGGPPDTELLAAAANGSIQDGAVRGQHAARLLETAAGRARLADFVSQWLHLEELQGTQKSETVYPQFDETLRGLMEREAHVFVEHALFDTHPSSPAGTLAALLTRPTGFVDQRLAGDVYGVSVPAGGAGATVDEALPEEFVLQTAGSGEHYGNQTFGRAFWLWANGSFTASLEAPAAGEYQIAVTGWGTTVAGTGCTYELLVDGQLKGNRTIAGSEEAAVTSVFSATLSEGAHTVEVRFINDAVQGGEDRNLIIASVQLQEPGGGEVVVKDGLTQVELPGRPGLLTKAGVLAAFANSLGSSPVKRGLLIRNRLLCQDIPPPPPDASTTPPNDDEETEIHTTRDRYEVHVRDPRCASCHDQIDPLGFAFERYDGIGVYRTEENGHPVDPTGAVRGTLETNAPFDDAEELLALLEDSPDVRRCLAQTYAMHVFGTATAFSDLCVDQTIAEVVEDSGGSLTELARRLPTLDVFIQRR